jgi:hypothetical protein
VKPASYSILFCPALSERGKSGKRNKKASNAITALLL